MGSKKVTISTAAGADGGERKSKVAWGSLVDKESVYAAASFRDLGWAVRCVRAECVPVAVCAACCVHLCELLRERP